VPRPHPSRFLRILLASLALAALPPAGSPGEDAAGAARAAAEAKRLFDLGDHAGAEREVSAALALLPESARAERAVRLAQRAEARVLLGATPAALEDIALALSLDDSVAVRRSALFVCLRSQRYREALGHADVLIPREPGVASHRLARGLALVKEGRPEEALPDLARGLEIPEARREARFALALALGTLDRPREALMRLVEILEEDPFDAEAVYQASRQVLRLRGPESARVAALLSRYFEALRAEEGPASRDQHLLLAGQPLAAARERASRWERLGRFDRALAEADVMRRLAPAGREADAWLQAFWERQGYATAPPAATLEQGIRETAAAGDAAGARRRARLLLALEPRSRLALETLAAAASDPELLVPRLHYARRLSALDPGSAWAAEHGRIRALLGGKAGPERPVR
jgi:hypothetical protein